MNKWQKQINKYAKFKCSNKESYYKNFDFRKCRIRLQANIKKNKWSYEELREIVTNYIKRHTKIFNEVQEELKRKSNI